jgi:hypothetical protein
MKFTIDTENNKILFHEPFTIEDLQHVLSLINIDGVEEWKVDMADDYLSDRPTDTITNPILPHWTYYGDNTGDPHRTHFHISSNGTGHITYGSTTTGEITFNNSTDTLTINTLDGIYNLND